MFNLNKVENQILGDRHNGGKSVFLNKNGLVEKPRPCLAEWFFLSKNSPLRIFLNETPTFGYFPNLEFYGNNFSKQGTVDFLSIDSSLTAKGHAVEASEAVGNLLAISQWFGLSDFHYENIKYGVNNNGRFILAPIDIECFFQKITLPFQTGLISKDNTDVNYGVKKIIDSGALLPVQVIEAYLNTMKIFFSNQKEIFKIVNGVFSKSDISRVLLQDTKVYKVLSSNGMTFSSFLPEESIQLKAGDVPYFFRHLDSHKINYWNNNEITEVNISTSSYSILPQVALLELNIYWNELANSTKHGALQIADRLIGKINLYHEESSELELKKNDNKIEIITKDWRVKCVV